MRTGMRIKRENIHLLANEVGKSAETFYNEMVDAKSAFRREENERWAYEFFGQDEQWYKETIEKVKEIRDTLPKEMDHQEATIEIYAWITKNGKKNLSMPMMYSDKYDEYAHAITVEYILTRLDSYHRAMNWS